jgi:drug/metabolite transporter (DMT)-like permease
VLVPPGFSTTQIVWGRYGVQLLILTALVMPFRGPAMIRATRPGLQVLRGSMMVLMPAAFALAIRRIGPSEAWAAMWIAPLAGVVLGERLIGERVEPLTWALVIAATLGAMLAHEPGSELLATGLAAAVVSGAAFGAFLMLTRKLRGDGCSTGLFWTAASVFIPVSLVVGHSWQPITMRAAVGLTVIGTLWLLVLLFIDEALRRAPLALIAPFLLTEIIWSRILFRVPWTVDGVVGGLVVLASALGCVHVALRTPRGAARSLQRIGHL